MRARKRLEEINERRQAAVQKVIDRSDPEAAKVIAALYRETEELSWLIQKIIGSRYLFGLVDIIFTEILGSAEALRQPLTQAIRAKMDEEED